MNGPRTTCRGCAAAALEEILDLGEMPPAGGHLLAEDLDEERRRPLVVVVCADCSLVQVRESLPPDEVFGDYRYASSGIGPLREHFSRYADSIVSGGLVPEGGLVVEFGSNDGVLLEQLARRGVRCVGVDPSVELTAAARSRGLDSLTAYFDGDTARRIRGTHGPAALVTGSNVFAHLDDPGGVVDAARELLAPGGVFAVEVHYVFDLLDGTQYDTIYHEHILYYSLASLSRLLERNGMRVFDAVRTDMHGGALRVLAARDEEARPVTERFRELRASESERGVDEIATYRGFGERARAHAVALRALLVSLKEDGLTISGYGAPGRGTILLNYAGIGPGLLDYVTDDSPLRTGRLMPGVYVPTVPTEEFRRRPTDVSLVLAWNYFDSIREKERWYLEQGGRFLVPLPEMRIVGNG